MTWGVKLVLRCELNPRAKHTTKAAVAPLAAYTLDYTSLIFDADATFAEQDDSREGSQHDMDLCW
jgi:hypothetical protein